MQELEHYISSALQATHAAVAECAQSRLIVCIENCLINSPGLCRFSETLDSRFRGDDMSGFSSRDFFAYFAPLR
jgi:hypothetical protein